VCEALDLVLGPERPSRRSVVDEHDFFCGKYLDDTGKLVEIRIRVVRTDLSDEARNASIGTFASLSAPSPAKGRMMMNRFVASSRAIVCISSALALCTEATQARAADLLVGTNGSAGLVSKYDADTGAAEGTVVALGGATHIIEGLTVGPDGNLYVSNYDGGFGAVQKYSPGGTYLGDFTSVMLSPAGSAFGPDGNLYVASTTGNFVARFSGTTGTLIDYFVSAGLGGVSAPSGIAFGPDGNLYVGSTGTSTVLRYSGMDGSFLGIFATVDGMRSGWQEGVGFGPDHNLYVASTNTGTIQRFDGQTGASMGIFASGLTDPTVFAWGPDSDLYVAEDYFFPVKRFNGSTGAFVRDVVTAGLAYTYGLAFIIDDDSTYAELNGPNIFTGNQAVNGTVSATSFVGDGSKLTGVGTITGVTAGSGLTGGGTTGNAQLAVDSTVARTTTSNTFAGNQTISGTVAASLFSGNGSALVGLSPASLSPGTAAINISGTAANALNAANLGNYPAASYPVLNNPTPPQGNLIIGGTIQASALTVAQAINSGSVNAGALNSQSLTIGGGTSAITEFSSITYSFTSSNALPKVPAGSCMGPFSTAVVPSFLTGISDTIALGIPSGLLNVGSGIFLLYQAFETNTNAGAPTSIAFQVCNPSGKTYQGGATGQLRFDIFKHQP
jgi:WD40 repeat protein